MNYLKGQPIVPFSKEKDAKQLTAAHQNKLAP